MQLSFARKLNLCFVVAFFFATVVAAMTFMNTARESRINRAARQSRDTQGELSETLSLFKDAETGQRGFLITGDEHYLEPYHAAIRMIGPHFQHLRVGAAGDPAQQRGLRLLEPIIQTKLGEMNQTIVLRRARGFEAARQVVATGRGKSAMDAARRLFAQLIAEQSAGGETLHTQSEASHRSTVGAVIALILVEFALLAFTRWLIRYDTAQRRQVQMLQGEARAALEAQNEEMMVQQAQLEQNAVDASEMNAMFRQTSERFQQLFQGLPIPCFCYNKDGRIYEWNRAFEAQYGLRAEDLLDRNLWQVFASSQMQDLGSQLIVGVFSGKSYEGLEWQGQRQDGTPYSVVSNAFPIHDAADEVVAAICVTLDITERKRAEEKMQTSKAFLRGVIDSSPDCLKVLDLDARLLSMNEGGQCLMEVDDFTSVAGASWPGFWQGDDQEKANSALQSARAGSVGRFQGFCPTAKGTPKWWDVMVSPILDGEGMTKQILAVSRDITDQRHAHEELQQAREQMESAQALAHVGSWEFDARTQKSAWSDEMFRIFGLEPAPQPPTSEESMALVHPDDHALLQTSLADAFSLGKPYALEHRFLQPDGSLRHVHALCQPKMDSAGGVQHLLGTVIDITERKLAENALRASNERLETLVQSAPLAIFTFDPAGIVQSWNPAAERIFGWSEAEAIGVPLPIVTPDQQAEFETLCARLILGENFTDRETQRCRKDGTQIDVSISAVPLHEADGRIVGVLGVLTEITERKQAEERIKDYTTVLEFQKTELEKANAQFAALATTDGLTGLKNHRAFQEILVAEYDRAVRYGTPLSVLMLDVDKFKQYNDTYGHPAGDGVLRTVARLLEAGVRDTDFVARYGGEEFVIVLPHTDSEGACLLAERLRSAIEDAAWPQRRVTASFGAATLDCSQAAAGRRKADWLVTDADRALYASKGSGRNQVTHADALRVRDDIKLAA